MAELWPFSHALGLDDPHMNSNGVRGKEYPPPPPDQSVSDVEEEGPGGGSWRRHWALESSKP